MAAAKAAITINITGGSRRITRIIPGRFGGGSKRNIAIEYRKTRAGAGNMRFFVENMRKYARNR